jgi:antitoxin HicB
MYKFLKIPLVLEPQDEGGWTVTSPLLPELITEIDDLEELHEALKDAVQAVIELYEDMEKAFPDSLLGEPKAPVRFESLILVER